MAINDLTTSTGILTFGATVATGFESTALEEIKEKITKGNELCEKKRGRVYFQARLSSIGELHKLRSVDKLFLVIKNFEEYVYHEDRDEEIKKLFKLPEDIPWDEVVKVWRENFKFRKSPYKKRKYGKNSKSKGKFSNTLSAEKNGDENEVNKKENSVEEVESNCEELNALNLEDDDDVNQPKDEKVEDIQNADKKLEDPKNPTIRFRVSANRVGKQQSITSIDAEQHFGGSLQDVTLWKVDLTTYNLEVLVNLDFESVMISLSLTPTSLHHRNISHFGLTTLRATLAYNMLRMCDLKPGEIVVDPMCGCGAISIEACHDFGHCFHMATDIAIGAVVRARNNVKFLNQKKHQCSVEVLRLDTTNLPWRDDFIDVVITDLPFGKRHGSRQDNRTLYPSILFELARVSRLGIARACLLTYDRRSMIKALALAKPYWKLKHSTIINIGGLRAEVFLLHRLNCKFVPSSED